ncbi:hypothetical protein KCU83_g278, partial [Aureobasidium melanogenum]
MLVLGFYHVSTGRPLLITSKAKEHSDDWASAQNELRVEKRLCRSALSRASLSAACSAALVARSEVPENVFLCIGTMGLCPLMEELLGAPLRRFAFIGVCAVCSTSSSSSLPNDGNGFGAGVAHRLLLPLLKVQNMKLPRKVPSAPGTCCHGFSLQPNTMQSTVPAIVTQNHVGRSSPGCNVRPHLHLAFWLLAAVCPSARILVVLAGKDLEALAYMDPLQCNMSEAIKAIVPKDFTTSAKYLQVHVQRHDEDGIICPKAPRRRDTPEKLMYHSDLKKVQEVTAETHVVCASLRSGEQRSTTRGMGEMLYKGRSKKREDGSADQDCFDQTNECVPQDTVCSTAQPTQSQGRGEERERERRFAESNPKGARDFIPYSRKFQTAFRHLLYCSVCPHFAACLVLRADVAVAACRGMCSCPR